MLLTRHGVPELFFAGCRRDARRQPARIQSDAVDDLRIGQFWTSMGGNIELALRRVPKPP